MRPARTPSRRWLPLVAAAAAALLAGCAGPKYTVDDGRPVNPQLLDNLRVYGQGEQMLRPAIRRTAALNDPDCDRQWELPFTLASSKGWEENDRVAWVRALGVDERLTVIATSADSPLKKGARVTDIDGYTSSDPADLLEQLARLRDRGAIGFAHAHPPQDPRPRHRSRPHEALHREG